MSMGWNYIARDSNVFKNSSYIKFMTALIILKPKTYLLNGTQSMGNYLKDYFQGIFYFICNEGFSSVSLNTLKMEPHIFWYLLILAF